MAPTTNGIKSQPSARRPLIQPALPALPLLLNTKKRRSFGSGQVTPSTTEERASSTPEQEPLKTSDIRTPNHVGEGAAGDEVAKDANVIQSTETALELVEPISELDVPAAPSVVLEGFPVHVDNDNNEARSQTEASKATIQAIYDGTSDHESLQKPIILDGSQSPSSQAPEVNINHLRQASSDNLGLNLTTNSPYSHNRSRPLSPNIGVEAIHQQVPSPLANGISNGNYSEPSYLRSSSRDNTHQAPPPHMRVNSSTSRVSSMSAVNGHTMSPGPVDDVATSEQLQISFALPTLATHLLHLANTKLWADWMIDVKPIRPGFLFVSYGHGTVLCRSLRVQNLMSQAQETYSTNVITLHPPRMIVPHAFEAALRFFYSDSVLSEDGVLPHEPGTSPQSARLHMYNYIVSYWISGIELGLAPVSQRAAKILPELLDWDLLEQATKDGLDLIGSADSPLHKLGVDAEYTKAGTQILRTVARFISYRLNPVNFQVDTSAHSELIPPRLPESDSSHSTTNPALASMVFGSMPAQSGPASNRPSTGYSDGNPVFANNVVSKILLNVNYEVLRLFATQLLDVRGSAAGELVSQVVEERENRRLRALSAKPNRPDLLKPNAAVWPALEYQESFEGSTLQRTRISNS